MKKRITYRDEPKDGMELPEEGSFGVLSSEQARVIGLPAVNPPGTEYERTENAAGQVRLRATRGGRREGAGRKASGHVRMQLLVSPKTRKKIAALARRQRVSLSEAVERAVAATD